MRLIDADYLKKAIAQNRDIDSDSVCDVLDIIDNAPTITPDKIQAIMSDYLIYRCEPKRPQGEWVYTDKEDKEKGYGGYCSVCKCDMPIGIKDWKQEYYESKFCPNCGAKMRKPIIKEVNNGT